MKNKCFLLLLSFSLSFHSAIAQEPQTIEKPSKQDEKKPSGEQVISKAVSRLIELQHKDGAWPYEGVYRVNRKIPVGYRIGGTAIVCSALLSADKDQVYSAISKGTDLILKELEDPLMKPSRTQRYDVRIWGHIYALDFFCRMKKTRGFSDLNKKTELWIKKLADAVVFQEIDGGGWNYANKRRHCCFVTSPAVQSLLLAKQLGMAVPDEVLKRSMEILKNSRKDDTIFPYSGTNSRRDTQAGSIARGPVSEATLHLLGDGDESSLQDSIDLFHQNWDELEKRRKKTGTHLPPHGIAPYYFYYGHRYVAQAIRMLPQDLQDVEFEKFKRVLMKTMDPDNTWNDRVFDQSKAYGTAMSLLALSRDKVILPKVDSATE